MSSWCDGKRSQCRTLASEQRMKQLSALLQGSILFILSEFSVCIVRYFQKAAHHPHFFLNFAGYCCACACLRVDIPARASVPVPVSIWFSILLLKWFINCPCLSVVDPIISDWQVDRLGLKWEGAPGCLLIYIGFSLQWFLPNKERLIICL